MKTLLRFLIMFASMVIIQGVMAQSDAPAVKAQTGSAGIGKSVNKIAPEIPSVVNAKEVLTRKEKS